MNYNKYFIFLVTISIIFYSCKTQDESLNVINIKQSQGVRDYSNLYTLPKTVIRVNVRFTQTVYKRGPFSKYAKSLLGIENAITDDEILWDIAKVDFNTYPVPDTNHIYIIEQANKQNVVGLSLTQQGFIKSVNADKNKLLPTNKNPYEFSLDYNKKGTILDKADIPNYNDVPVLKDVQARSTVFEKAKAIAEKIYTLRDDRAAIIVGDGYTEAMPDGLALKEIVRNLNSLEQKYLSLFTGKKLRREFNYSYDFIPASNKKITQAILFRFSTTEGVVPFNNVNGLPVIIKLNSYQNISPIIEFNKKQEHLKRVADIDKEEQGLYYRIPEMGLVELLINEEVVAEKKIILAQFGEVHSLNPKYMDGNYIIEFYTELGSIKQISKINKQAQPKN